MVNGEPGHRVTLNARGEQRVRSGHPWIYRADVVEVDASGGVVVTGQGGDHASDLFVPGQCEEGRGPAVGLHAHQVQVWLGMGEFSGTGGPHRAA